MAEKNDVRYELYYWPGIQGRGELVRLAFEEAGVPYVDVGRQSSAEGGGIPAMQAILESEAGPLPPFAPPFLRVGDLVIAQTAAILHYLGPRLGLVPDDEASRLHVHQLQLTLSDLVAEVHDTHHPIATSLYYEDQKPEAKRRARAFVGERMPKFLGYFERVLAQNPAGGGKHLVGSSLTYADLSLFHVVAGLRYAFPKAVAWLEPTLLRTVALHDSVAARPRIAAYLASPRRLPFSEHGVFRHYPELDG
jgi:glutathione S-transferase